MIFSFSNNPIDKIWVDILNKYEKWTQKKWQSKKQYVKCRICGKELHSDKMQYSPEQCGWRHLKQINSLEHWKWGWICHSCDGHFDEHWVDVDKLKENISDDLYNELWKKGVIRYWNNWQVGIVASLP